MCPNSGNFREKYSTKTVYSPVNCHADHYVNGNCKKGCKWKLSKTVCSPVNSHDVNERCQKGCKWKLSKTVCSPVNCHADHDVDGSCHETVEGRQGQVSLVERDRVESSTPTLAQSNQSREGTDLFC